MRNCKQRPKCLAGSNNGFQTCTRRLQSQAPNQHTPTHHPGRAFFFLFCFVLFCFVGFQAVMRRSCVVEWL